jgi:hypothetical protein
MPASNIQIATRVPNVIKEIGIPRNDTSQKYLK